MVLLCWKILSMICAWRTALVLFFSQWAFLIRFEYYAIHGYACHNSSAVLADHCCALQIFSKSLTALILAGNTLLFGLIRLR